MKNYYLCDEMSRLFYIVLSLVTIVACVTACNSRDALDRIDAAEAVVETCPDSAFALLQEVDPERLHGWETPARYALAYTTAQIKCGIRVDDDSLIRVAVDYYRPDSTVEHMRSLYYLARICQNANKLPAATKHYSDAEKIALRLNDHFFLGLIYRGLADVYDATSTSGESVRYSLKSLDNFLSHNDSIYIRYALADLANCYTTIQDYDKSMNVANQALKMSIESNDSACAIYTLNIMASCGMSYKDYAKSRDIYLRIKDSYPNCVNASLWNRLGLCCFYLSETDSCHYYLNKASQAINTRPDSIEYFYNRYQISYLEGNDRDAMQNLEKAVTLQNRITDEIFSQSAAIAQRDYYREDNQKTKQILQTTQQRIIYTSIVLLLVITITVLFIRNRWANKNFKISENARLILELSRKYEIFKENAEHSMQEHLAQIEKSNIQNDILAEYINKSNNAREIILTMFREQIAAVERVSKKILLLSTLPTTNKKLAKIDSVIQDAVADFAPSDETFQNLESVVNSMTDDIMVKIRIDFPKFTERDYRILCCFYAGFSASEVALFLGEDINNVYRLKSRLKKRIAESDSPNKIIFLDKISIKD